MLKKDPRIIHLMYILKDFDTFLEGIRYVEKYNSRFRDYEYELHKLNYQTAYMYILHNKIEIHKKSENKFEVIINFDNFQSIAERRRLTKFMMIDNMPFFESLVYFKGQKIYFRFKDLFYNYRNRKSITKLTFVKRTEKYYLTLPELEKREIPEKEYGFPIISNLLYLHKINDKKVSEIIEYHKSKCKIMPYYLKVKMKNRKIEHAIFKMLINKGIMKYDKSIKFDKHTLNHLRIENYDIETYKFEYTNMIIANNERLRGNDFPLFKEIIIQDFDYDNVNQILLKLITPLNENYLCGVDYSNSLWCVRLSEFMIKYKIKSVYKVLYDLDENTKVFEF
jgi:hypothetical protein